MGKTLKTCVKPCKSRRNQLANARRRLSNEESKCPKIDDESVTEPPAAVSASRRKIDETRKAASPPPEDERPATQQWLIMHVSRLNELLNDLLCPNCMENGLSVNIDPQNQGFCSSLMLECSECKQKENGYRKSVFSSSRLQESSRGDVAFDVNVRMVLLAHELGLGYTALKKISKVLGIPSLHLKTYQRHDRRVTGTV